MKQKVLFEELTPEEFRIRLAEAPIAYLPLGTLEWHGEHLPLGSDSVQPSSFFQELAIQVGGIVMPALFLGPDKMEVVNDVEYYGKDRGNNFEDEKQRYDKQILAGSVYWIPDSLFISLLESILKQLKRQGFKILVAHGHGPSTRIVMDHSELWEAKYGIKIFHLWGSENDDWNGFMYDHAAMLETSVVMKYRPDLVHMENLSPNPDIWPLGVRGYDPRFYASLEKGNEIVNIQMNRIVTKLKEALKK